MAQRFYGHSHGWPGEGISIELPVCMALAWPLALSSFWCHVWGTVIFFQLLTDSPAWMHSDGISKKQSQNLHCSEVHCCFSPSPTSSQPGRNFFPAWGRKQVLLFHVGYPRLCIYLKKKKILLPYTSSVNYSCSSFKLWVNKSQKDLQANSALALPLFPHQGNTIAEVEGIGKDNRERIKNFKIVASHKSQQEMKIK